MSDGVVLPPRVEGLRKALAVGIPILGDEFQGRAELDAMNLGDLLAVYVNWMSRLPQRKPRRVRFAADFWTEAAEKARPEIAALEAAVRNGDDLLPFLSDRAARDGYTPKGGRTGGGIVWGDKDFALNAWGVHHLHLGKAGLNQRVQRTADLLYVCFTRDEAVFLLLGNHRSFDDGRLERSISTHQALEGRLTINGVVGLTRHYSPQERTKLARYGIMTLAQIGDAFVISGSASTAGTSVYASRMASALEETLLETDHLLDDPAFIVRMIEKSGRTPSDEEWRWVLHHCDLCFGQEDNVELLLVLPGPF